MAHRESIKEYLRAIRLENKKIIDWGSGTKPVSKYIQNGDCDFTTIDKLDHVGATVVADISKEGFFLEPYTLYDVAFCMEVLEHVENPEHVLNNIWSHLKPEGEFYFSVPFLYPVHSDQDYWRFTDQGLKLLLERSSFRVVEIKATEDSMGWIGKAVKK